MSSSYRTRVVVLRPEGILWNGKAIPCGATVDLPANLAADLERHGRARAVPMLAPRPPRPEPRLRRPLPIPDGGEPVHLPRYTTSDPDDAPRVTHAPGPGCRRPGNSQNR